MSDVHWKVRMWIAAGPLAVLLWAGSWACQETGTMVYDDDAADDDTAMPDDDTADDDTAMPDDDTELPQEGVYFGAIPDFEVNLGCADNQGMSLFNDTEVDVTVEELDLGAEDSDFALMSAEPPPWIVAAGASAPFAVLFEPGTLGTQEIDVVAATDHAGYPEVTGQVVGHGLAEDDWMDVFFAPDANTLDILWVVDNSCSMPEEQDKLAEMAAPLIEFLATGGFDVQMGVVTTDNATLQAPVIDAAAPDAVTAFADAVYLGTGGSGTEQPLSYGLAALSSPLVDPGGANEGLIRQLAGLAVIAVTDEDDQSTGTADEYATSFLALKDDPDTVAVSAVDGGPTGCTGYGGEAFAATKLHNVVDGTGGVEGSICDDDWMPVLQSIPALTAQPQYRYCLTFTPFATSLEVTVDGTELTEGWSYDEAANCIEFEAGYVPVPGAEILVYYAEPAGGC